MKRWIWIGAGLMVAGLALGPCVGGLTVLVTPGMADAKFVSARDGSIGPAFWLCLGVWGATTAVGIVAGALAMALGARRRRASSSTPG